MRLLAITALLAVGSLRADAQQLVTGSGPVASPFAKDYKVDFSIPDAPAFKLLEVDQSAILRPQTVRALTLAASNFRGEGGGFVVPREFGIEASPALLIGSRYLPVADYRRAKFLYATRVSGAARRDTLGRAQLAAGVRLSLVDDQDLRTDQAFPADSQVTPITRKILVVYREARRRIGPVDSEGNPQPIVLNDAEQKQVEALNQEIRDIWARRHWNARSTELALAARAATADSMGHDPRFDEFAAWASHALPLGTGAQLIVGIKAGVARDSLDDFTWSDALAGRMYFGANDAKLFLEAQRALSAGATVEWLVNSGVEFRVPKLGWVNASIGVQPGKDGQRARALTSFTYKADVPGLP